MEMRGRRVVVTAGAAGIGRAIAEELAAAGARVHVTDISEAAVADAVAGVPGLSGTTGDASLVRDVDRVLDEVVERLGGLDVLVNNVGVAGPTGGIETYADADVERTIDVNLQSHFYFLNRFVPLLKQSTANPSILAISSVAGRLGYGLRTPYCGDEMGHRRPREVAGRGTRAARDSRQRHPARRRRRRPHGGRDCRARRGRRRRP